MVQYYGDFAEDDTVLIPFNTFDSNDPSASVTITNLADADIKVHKDGSVTQIVTDGATIAVDFDTITGNHLATIDTSAHADYAVGSEYAVRIEGTTVDGATVNAWIGAFSIERAGGVLALMKATTLASIKAETALIVADTNELQGDWTNAGRLDAILDIIAADVVNIDGIVPAAAGDSMALTAGGVDAIWDEVISGAAHNTTNTAGRRLRELRESGFYTDGFIYIDTVNGAADSTDYEAGTEVNPTNSIANANTIAASLGLSKFKIVPGSTITLAAAQTNQFFQGEAWTLALGAQNVSGSTFKGAAVSGICTNTTDAQFFCDCLVSAVTVPTDTHFLRCGHDGKVTAGEAGDFFFDGCHSAIAGTGSVEFDFGAALAASNLNVRHHSGGWNISNMGAGAGTYNASFEGNGQIVWNASCSATSNASIRGNWKITDNASAAVTETLDDNQAGVDTLLSDWNDGGRLDLILDAILDDTDLIDDGTSGLAKIATDVAATLVDTAVIGALGAGLTNIPWNASWDAQVESEVIDGLTAYGAPTYSKAEIADSVWDEDLSVGHAVANSAAVRLSDTLVDTAVIGAAGAGLTALPWNAAWDAEVESEVNDALDTAISELGVAAPTATPTIRTGIMLSYMALRNKLTSTATEEKIHNDAGTAIATSTLSDDATTATKGEFA